MIYVGLDVSLTSPGISVYDLFTKNWSSYCFQQRKRENCLTWSNNVNFSLTVLPPIPVSSNSDDCIRYNHIVSNLENIIKKHNTTNNVKDVVLIIENYAFAAQGASSFKLIELGGIIKFHFREYRTVVIGNNTWKKVLTGNGRCSKKDTLDTINKLLNIDICQILKLSLPKGRYDYVPTYVPTPAQDVADSIGVVLGHLFAGRRHLKKKNNNKRKKNDEQVSEETSSDDNNNNKKKKKQCNVNS